MEFEEQDGMAPLVLAVMDGGAREIADVDEDGRWIGVRTEIGRRKSWRSSPRSAGATQVSVEHSHARVIEAWRT